jgi:DNA-binding response OmpR family regulator
MSAKRGAGTKILLVDDDKHLLRTLGDFLAFEGFEVVTALSAESALAALEKKTPDLVILDIGMPGIGGLGFLRKVTLPDGNTKCPVIVLTARSMLEKFFDGLDVAAFLVKPCDTGVLLNKIRAVLDQSASDAARDGGSAKRVLLGEDDVRVAVEITGELREAGCTVDVAGSGPEVLETAASSRPDAVLIKEILPGMNGSVLAPILAAMRSTKGIPIILYETQASALEEGVYSYRVVDRPLAAQAPAGVARHLQRPTLQDLTKAVRTVLDL